MDTKDKLHALRQMLGSLVPPEEVTQEAFEAGPEHLQRLAEVGPGQQANVWDLAEYTYDLLYSTEIQVPLFLYLLPFCLGAWNEYLRNDKVECPGFTEGFYTALVERRLLTQFLTPAQSDTVLEFMRVSILEEIDSQNGLHFTGYPAPPFRWIPIITTYAVFAPDIERIWSQWWSVSTPGRAIAAIQYVSCLMYPKDDNPVFAPYTREKGGGPPCLWQFVGYIYEHHWQPANAKFLEGLLDDPNSVSSLLSNAVERLIGLPEHTIAMKVLADLPSCAATLKRRCVALPYVLATRNDFPHHFDWPE